MGASFCPASAFGIWFGVISTGQVDESGRGFDGDGYCDDDDGSNVDSNASRGMMRHRVEDERQQ